MQAHLAWLDGEIAAAVGRAEPPGPGLPPTPALPDAPPPPAPATPPAPVPAGEGDAEALIKQYGHDPASSTADVKRGCWIVFVGAFLAVGLLVVLWAVFRQGP